LYDSTLRKLKSVDADQEVKEKSIVAIANLISGAGDELQPSLAACWPLLLSRLQNEVN
jgi:hypothetical protein